MAFFPNHSTFGRRKERPVSKKWTRYEVEDEQPPRYVNNVEPKVEKKGLRNQGTSERSRQRRAWDRELKRWMKDSFPERCESCGTTLNLTVMHATKRRFITTKEDYFRAAKVCWTEHQSYDEAKGKDVHQRMADFVDGLIARRNKCKL